MENKEKHAGGRPTKYKPEFCERMKELATEGQFQGKWWTEFGIDHTTATNWKKEYPEFLTAYRIAKTILEGNFVSDAVDVAFNRMEGNPSLIKFFLSGVFGISEKTEIKQEITTIESSVDFSDRED